jgi:hypothetical protein
MACANNLVIHSFQFKDCFSQQDNSGSIFCVMQGGFFTYAITGSGNQNSFVSQEIGAWLIIVHIVLRQFDFCDFII